MIGQRATLPLLASFALAGCSNPEVDGDNAKIVLDAIRVARSGDVGRFRQLAPKATFGGLGLNESRPLKISDFEEGNWDCSLSSVSEGGDGSVGVRSDCMFTRDGGMNLNVSLNEGRIQDVRYIPGG